MRVLTSVFGLAIIFAALVPEGCFGESSESISWADPSVLGEGILPSLAFAKNNSLQLAYLLQSESSELRFDYIENEIRRSETVSEQMSNFRPELCLNKFDVPFIAYLVQGGSGDLEVARRLNVSDWETEWLGDGAESFSFVFDRANRPHLAVVNLGTTGIQHVCYDRGTWQVEQVDNLAAPGKGIAVVGDLSSAAHLFYDDSATHSLMHSWKSVEGSWNKEVIESVTDALFFPSAAVDGEGDLHLAYLRFVQPATEESSMSLVYAEREEDEWHVDTIHVLDATAIPTDGLTRLLRLRFDRGNSPWIAYCDGDGISLVFRNPLGWKTCRVVSGQGNEVGMHLSFLLDQLGDPHVASHVLNGETVGHIYHFGGTLGVVARSTDLNEDGVVDYRDMLLVGKRWSSD